MFFSFLAFCLADYLLWRRLAEAWANIILTLFFHYIFKNVDLHFTYFDSGSWYTFGGRLFIFWPTKHAHSLTSRVWDQPGDVWSQMLVTFFPCFVNLENAKYFRPPITTSNPWNIYEKCSLHQHTNAHNLCSFLLNNLYDNNIPIYINIYSFYYFVAILSFSMQLLQLQEKIILTNKSCDQLYCHAAVCSIDIGNKNTMCHWQINPGDYTWLYIRVQNPVFPNSSTATSGNRRSTFSWDCALPEMMNTSLNGSGRYFQKFCTWHQCNHVRLYDERDDMFCLKISIKSQCLNISRSKKRRPVFSIFDFKKCTLNSNLTHDELICDLITKFT